MSMKNIRWDNVDGGRCSVDRGHGNAQYVYENKTCFKILFALFMSGLSSKKIPYTVA